MLDPDAGSNRPSRSSGSEVASGVSRRKTLSLPGYIEPAPGARRRSSDFVEEAGPASGNSNHEGSEAMSISRRTILTGALAAPAVIAAARLGSAAPGRNLKISHQFPGGTIDEGDFRDRLCLKFAAELEKRSGGEIGGQVYPNSSLMKTIPQFSSLRRGALDLSFYPISYAGGELPETNIGLMPGLVSSYKQGAAWKT